jgi:hypothetical protein
MFKLHVPFDSSVLFIKKDPALAAPSAVIMSCSLQAVELEPRRVRWAELPSYQYYLNETSPALTSDPIPIPNRNQERNLLRGSWISPRKPTAFERTNGEDRIHNKLDNVADYCKRGYCGWESAHDKCIETYDEEVGKMLAGQWPDRKKWNIPKVVRRDVNSDEALEEAIVGMTLRRGGGRIESTQRNEGQARFGRLLYRTCDSEEVESEDEGCGEESCSARLSLISCLFRALGRLYEQGS